MFNLRRLSSALLIGLVFLTACSIQSGSAISDTPTDTLPSPPTLTATATALPTPSSPSDSILWDNLKVTIDQAEITQAYINKFGSIRNPPAGKKILWIHIHLKNTGSIEMDVPILENYSILYAAIEIKPIYGHRQGYAEYTTLGSTVFPDQELNGWLRFDIPATAELREMQFVFIPESAQIGTSYDSPSFPYADDKPTYVWNFEP
ncbi:MAG TPA: DUF4352 domain-containing protein [Anaerolineales bacterium]|nr:DUF4352 domain-containing protein [Anaerolineales bacterium]